MRARPKQNRFNAGVLDEALLSSDDLEQYKAGLRRGDNCYLLAQGGARRRPGTYKCEEAPAAFVAVEFKFSRGQEYLFLLLPNTLWVIFDGAKITDLTTPWDADALLDMGWDSELDTTMLTHEDVEPRRLVRGMLDADPLTFTSGSAIARVRQPSHRAEANDYVGLSGLSAAAGLTAAQLNKGFQITLIAGNLAADPVTTFDTEKRVRVAMPSHSFRVGQRVTFENLAGVGDVPATEINKSQTLTAVDAAWVEFAQAMTATDSISGGGSAGTYKAPDEYQITLPAPASSSMSGGGSNGRGWVLTTPEHENVPWFDFDDEYSPVATDEQQILTFTDFAEDDKFRLSLDGSETNKIAYSSADADKNVQRITDAIRQIGWVEFADRQAQVFGIQPIPGPDRQLGIVVSHLDGTPGGSADRYLVKFTGDQGGRDWPNFAWTITDSDNGLIAVDEFVAGGQRVEPVWSATRGWPRRVAFHLQRLVYGGSRSRPATRWGSKIGFPFNFDEGDSFAAEALNDTMSGSAKKIVQVVGTDRLVLLTESGPFVQFDGQAGTVTPDSVSLRDQNAYGSANVRPVRIGGSVLYPDVRGGAIRELAYSFEADKYVAPDISAFSSDLIKTPVATAVHRVVKGDYAIVVNADGTAAVLSRNAEQGVSGWTPWSTDGQIFTAASAGDWLYLGVMRTINGVARYFLERLWNPTVEYVDDIFVDCAVVLTGPATTWTGLDHLEGKTVRVCGDGQDVGVAVVTDGAVVTNETFDELLVGLPYTATLVPMPAQFALADGGTGAQVQRLLGGILDLQQSAGVEVNGFAIADRTFGDRALDEPPPALDGLYRFRCRGWGRRKNITITQSRPGPMTVRSIEPWIAYGGAG